MFRVDGGGVMNVLEKILEEIEEHTIELESFGMCDDYVSVGWVKEIIRSHTDEVDDSWIPVVWRETTDDDGVDKEKYPLFLDCPMPEDDTKILVSLKDGTVSEDVCLRDDGYYLDSGYDWIDDVVAWKPYPKPYKVV